MKRIHFIAVVLFVVAAGLTFAQKNDPYFAQYNLKIEQILAQNGDKPVGSLTVAEITRVLNEASIAKQEYLYIKRSEAMSFALPGLGQYANGDALSGSLFLGGELALFAGTIVGAYYLLPSNLQFQSINYFKDSFSSIDAAWNNHSLVDYLPSAAVLVGGAILQHIFRGISARHAARLAERNVKEGKVTFKPQPLMMLSGGGFPAFGMGMRMDY